MAEFVISIAATFTAEPVHEFLDFWTRELGIGACVEFAPFNQVFQQMLDPGSNLSRNQHGINVLLVRPEDLIGPNTNATDDIAGAVQSFTDAVDRLTQRNRTPLEVYLCPHSASAAQTHQQLARVQAVESELVSRLEKRPGIHIVDSAELSAGFPLLSYYAAQSDQQGAVPYTPLFFASFATHLARRITSLRATPRKVIVLDADDTLWTGLCGEDGWSGVIVDGPRRALQEFMIRQQDAGMLLCVCSKNAEADVLAVFDNHPDMLLRREHITAWRVNWQSKSDNLRSLAGALGLGLDSFMLIDDSPLERAEAEAQCPDVLVVKLPQNADAIPSFLESFWAFDRTSVTDEDKRRTELYRQNAQREDLRTNSLSLRSFLEGLELEMDIAVMEPRHIPRVAQLTQRTNQFNIRPLPRSEAALRALVGTDTTACLVVNVRDRFGDYGLVGVVIAALDGQAMRVETFLLSCRALGRGVEHRMLAMVGELAGRHGVSSVVVPVVETTRNLPVREFLQRVAGEYRQESSGGVEYRLPAARAAEISIEPWLDASQSSQLSDEDTLSSARNATPHSAPDSDQVAVLHRVATTLNDAHKVLAAVEARRARSRPASAIDMELPRNAIEERVGGLFSLVLGVAEIGIHDDFFDMGGHSILAMELISRAEEMFGVELPLRSVFESPTVAQMASAIADRTGSSIGSAPQPVATTELHAVPDQRSLPFPLTDIQQAYWLGRTDGFELGNVAAHYYIEVEYDELDLDRLNVVWQRLIERHDMLRAIVQPNGEQQVLDQVQTYQIGVLDVRGLSPAIAEAELARVRSVLSHEVRRADQWPLFEIQAIRLDNDRVRVCYSFDLIIADAFSLLLLSHEASQLYANPNAALAPLTISFRDYVMADVGSADEQAQTRAADYWRERLPTLPPPPELAFVKPPSTVSQPRFVRFTTELEPLRWQQFKARCAQAGLTPTATLLGAFAEVLGVWSKNPRFTLNLTVMNRAPLHEDVNRLVGEFTTLELLGIDTTHGETFQARVAHIQGQLWDDLDHRQAGGVQLIRDIARGTDPSSRARMPVVFTSTLSLGMPDGDTMPFAETGSPVFGITQTPQVLLDCGVFQQHGALMVTWDAVEELFPRGMLPDMHAAFSNLVRRLSTDEAVWAERHPVSLPVIQQQQRQAINDTVGPTPTRLLHSPFLEQAARQAHAPAVITRSRTLTYDQLRRGSNFLARELRERGARPNQLVAIVMEKGWEQVVATLGILESGAAYLPLDPDLPRERLWYLLEHGEVSLVVTQPWIDARLTWPATVERLCVDAESTTHEVVPLAELQSADDLAYVIYTSGSTGLPKGVMIDHRGALNTLVDLNERFDINGDDRVFGLSSLSFDLSVYDIFGTLAAGAAVVIPDASDTRDPMRWTELLQQQRVTIWNSVPALMQMLVEYVSNRPAAWPAALRLVWMSGDWIPVSLPDRIRAFSPEIHIISMGGATEASIWSILYPIERVDSNWRSIPYGRPMRNQTFHVLDGNLEPRPTWVPGELYIGGMGVAKGYWRDTERTNARFITHPHTGERLYRTGDMGRYLPSGDIEFLGREDTQVKIQGFRVELGEIEAALAQFAPVRDSVVVARDGTSALADKRLVAYIVPADGQSVSASLTRQFLAQKLPAYMVPVDYVELPSLPLTANGKVDRRALPAPQRGQLEVRDTYVAPRDAVESELVELWERVLGVRPIGVHDNFFDMGGHSILAVTVFGDIAKKYGRDLPLASLFRGPTIAQLAAILRADAEPHWWSPLVPVQTQGSRRPFFCLHSAGGNVLEYYPLAKHLGPDQPFYALQAQGLDGGPQGPDRLEDMAAQYVAAIRTVQPHGPYQLGGFCMGGMLAFEAAQQLRAAGEAVDLVVMIENPTLAYGQPLPGTTAMQRWFHRSRQRLQLEWANLEPLEWRARLAHASQRLARLVTLGLVEVEKVVEPVFHRYGLARAHSLARTLQSLTDMHENTLSAYTPKPYPGRVVLFRAQQQPWGIRPDGNMGWNGLIRGPFEVHVIPGFHKNVLKEPRVKVLADKLRAYLDVPAQQMATNATNGKISSDYRGFNAQRFYHNSTASHRAAKNEPV